MLNIRCLVLIPLGHTNMHLPQSMQWPVIDKASFSMPRPSMSITFRKFISLCPAVGQLAAQEPHAMHLATSGSAWHSSSNFDLSKLSSLMAELGDIPYPKSIIVFKIFVYAHCGSPCFCNCFRQCFRAGACTGVEYAGCVGILCFCKRVGRFEEPVFHG